MLVPLQVDVPMYRWPVANFAVIGVTVTVSLAAMGGAIPAPVLESMILYGWRPTGFLGYMLLHGGLLHLGGNMLFLWVFGNAVCAKTGNLAYLVIYAGMGVAAAAAHLLLDGAPAIGASGAVNGVMGMFLMLYPLNNITCGYFFIVFVGTFCVSSAWMILLWLAFDLWGAFAGQDSVAYWAHIGGIAAGFALAGLMVNRGWIRMSQTECTMLDYLRGRA